MANSTCRISKVLATHSFTGRNSVYEYDVTPVSLACLSIPHVQNDTEMLRVVVIKLHIYTLFVFLPVRLSVNFNFETAGTWQQTVSLADTFTSSLKYKTILPRMLVYVIVQWKRNPVLRSAMKLVNIFVKWTFWTFTKMIKKSIFILDKTSRR
jgi:hypothetical protein